MESRHAQGLSRYTVKDLGSVVVGEDGPALDSDGASRDGEKTKTRAGTATKRDGDARNGQQNDEHDAYSDDSHINDDDGHHDHEGREGDGGKPRQSDAHITLADARFVPGDYISCAVLPSLADGSVAPAGDARTGRGAGVGEARPLEGSGSGTGVAIGARPLSGFLDGASESGGWDRGRDRDRDRDRGYATYGREHENGFYPRAGNRGGAGGGDRSRHHRFGSGGPGGGGGGRRGGGGGGVPAGEWRRGERLPDVPPVGRGRDRGRR